MTAEIKENIKEDKVSDSKTVYRSGMPLYVLLPLCALASTFICTSGWRSGLRATLLGGSLLFGVFLVKWFCSSGINWKIRTAYFAFAGIITGLFAALIICAVELQIGEPVFLDNPYSQNTKNLFFICPLYGFFMLGCYSLAFNLPRMGRYFIVLSGAALANTFGLIDMAYNPELWIYILGTLRNCAIYYIPCLGNCVLFVLLWNLCVDRAFNLPLKRQPIFVWFACIVVGVVVGYLGFIFVGAMTLSINPKRYFIKYKDTVFNEKLTGVIIVAGDLKYYDCQKRSFYDLPKGINNDYDFTSKNKKLRVTKSSNNCYIEKLKDGEVDKKISLNGIWKYCIVNDSIYYTKNRKLFRLIPPGYDKAELILEDFRSYRFCISPDEKFIVYYKIVNVFEFTILCVMNLESKRVLALTSAGHRSGHIYWGNSIDELKAPKVIKKADIEK